jgi:phosphatidylinositol alpha-mannosyltransferase
VVSESSVEADRLQSTAIAYMFCGRGDRRGGVPDAINTLNGYMSEEVGVSSALFVSMESDALATRAIFNTFGDSIYHLGARNIEVQANGSRNGIALPVGRRVVANALSDTQPDVIHGMGPEWPWVGGRVLRQALDQDIPTLLTYHITSEAAGTNAGVRLAGRLDRRIMEQLDWFVAVSKTARHHAHDVYGYKGDVEIIPNGVDVRTFAEAEPFQSGQPFPEFTRERKTIVFVGRPDERKGLDELIGSVEIMQQDGPADFQLVVCGDGPERAAYEQYVQQHGLGECIYFAGQVSDDDKARWLATADLGVFPAKSNESQGIVLLEAMAAGALTLAGDNPGYSEVMRQTASHSEVLFDPNQVSDLAKRLRIFLDGHPDEDEIRRQQHDLVRTVYDIAITGQRYAQIYAQLADPW